ncbi:MAG: DEAD/DEAH box helicase family protein, partial [Candidatus Cloacimonetes bacterium]|nr:DEAD/DEAH box helicase family protein [Candidatus Cloacimonadota bacterium]
MRFNNQEINILSKRKVFGKSICKIEILSTGEILEVNENDIEKEEKSINILQLRYYAVASKIINEKTSHSILSPYESSLLPLPHQILALEKTLSNVFVRYLIADEVGMGKTIEAGLVIKELKLRGIVKRILVVVPKSAMPQWKSEMKLHFNETFHIYDTDFVNAMTRSFSMVEADNELNLWKQNNQIIVSTDTLRPLDKRNGWTKEEVDKYNEQRIKNAIDADFDLLIIDECHKVGGSSQTVGRYKMADELCNSIANVLLLSATPHRGKSDHFRRVLQLIDKDAFTGEGMPSIKEIEPYIVRTEKRLAIDYNGKPLFNKRRTERFLVYYNEIKHKKQQELYEDVTNYVKAGFNRALTEKNTSYGFVMILFQKLVSSSIAAIKECMKGRVERLFSEGNNNEDFIEEYNDNEIDIREEYEYDITGNIRMNGFSNNEEIEQLRELIKKAEDCENSETDAKAEALLEKLAELKRKEENPDLKFLIFTEFRATQEMLKRFLEDRGYRCQILNGGMSLEERTKALKDFKENDHILISTEAGGESLNMQFAYIIFNYDIPWNPMMIEQRIGRVDRIGQKHEVLAYNIFLNNSVDQRVYEVIVEKLNNILEQLGIDKTADVLDSTISTKDVNNLYLTSLIDSSSFEKAWYDL